MTQSHSYPCDGCGARVEYAPGTELLRCPYCGFEQRLAPPDRAVREHSYDELATLVRKPVATLGAHVFVCQKCGARTQSDALAQQCQFCGAPLVAEVDPSEQIAPEAVLPFHVDRDGMRAALRSWVSSRWFAPSKLKQVTEAESTRGTYLPHWTFDAKTLSQYTGQRGEHYWVTVPYTVTVNGRTETRTRTERRTRWFPASGTVEHNFDDVLVPATRHVTTEQLDELAPWPLAEAKPYRPDYLAGYHALRYETEPEAGLEEAKARMAPVIEEDCKRDIGGDEQRVQSVHTRHFEITYKLVLLPVWIACYVYAGKTWPVFVNARTAEVIGRRPYSVAKIAAAIIAALVLIAAIVTLYLMSRG